jgi:oligopeptidase B
MQSDNGAPGGSAAPDLSWLKASPDSPRLKAFLEEERLRTKAYMAGIKTLRESLFRELKARIEEPVTSAIYREGHWEYRSRIEKDGRYEIHERRPAETVEAWRIIFDGETEATGHPYFEVGLFDVSPDGTLLAYAFDTSGDERFTLKFRDLTTGKDLPVELREVTREGAWDAHSKAYFFLRENKGLRADRAYRHVLGEPAGSAACLYREEDERFSLSLDKSRDGKWIFLTSASQLTSEVHTLHAHDGLSFECFQRRREGIDYDLEHQDGHWLIRTNEGALDYQLFRQPTTAPSTGEATRISLVPPLKEARLTSVLPFEGALVVGHFREGQEHFQVLQPDGRWIRNISRPQPIHCLEPDFNPEYNTPWIRMVTSTPVHPPEVLDVHLFDHRTRIAKSAYLPEGHDPEAYAVYRREVMSVDGVRVPMTLIHRKGLDPDSTYPVFLYGYGAYGDTIEPSYRSSWLTWLERNCVVAVAHVRGGGFHGEAWHATGRRRDKHRSFEDFLACARDLVESGLTKEGNILIAGESAGGMLIGVALNRAPHLFRAALAEVPFVDCLQTMLDPELPLTTVEYEEWGDPRDPHIAEAFRTWSPCENVKPAAYPPILATAALEDARVGFHEAAKWVSLIRAHQQTAAPVLLHVEEDKGHGGATDRQESLRETALTQAFLLSTLPAHLSSKPGPIRTR